MSVSVAFDFRARSHVGLVRANNQDSGYAGPRLLLVADGMGGHAGGDTASAIAIANLAPLDGTKYEAGELIGALDKAIRAAQEELKETANARPQLTGMGTTVTAILRSGNKLAMAHIGDSRAYLLHDNQLTQITHDHTYVQHLIDTGRITPDQAHTHPQRSVVMRVLGDHELNVDLDLSLREAQVGDRWMLCSDGLSGMVSDETIAEVMSEVKDLDACIDKLMDLGLKGGGTDNITIILADIVANPNAPQNPDTAQATAVGAASALASVAATGQSHKPSTAPLPLVDEHDADEHGADQYDGVDSDGHGPQGDEPADVAQDREEPADSEQRLAGQGGNKQDSADETLTGPDSLAQAAQLAEVETEGENAGEGNPEADLDSDESGANTASGTESSASTTASSASATTAANPQPLPEPVIVGAAENSPKESRFGDNPASRAANLLKPRSTQAAAEPDPSGDPVTPHIPLPKKSRKGLWFTLVAISLLVVGGFWGGWRAYEWTQTQYYIAAHDDRVAIYQGVPQDLGPISLSQLHQDTDILLDDLPVYLQNQVRSVIVLDSLDLALDRVAVLEQQVVTDS